MSGGHKPRRIKYWPTPDTMAIALHRAAKPAAIDVAEVLHTLAGAAKAMREGVATELQWSMLAGSLDVALAIEQSRVVRGLQGHLDSIHQALQAVYNRAMQAGQWRAPALYYHELDALALFVELHTYQTQALSRGEYSQAIDTATRKIKQAGGTVQMLRDVRGQQQGAHA